MTVNILNIRVIIANIQLSKHGIVHGGIRQNIIQRKQEHIHIIIERHRNI
jgi:DNA transposition AAA+ family ATPase